jgi:primosomal protein N' (replication factor Y) (superfamily II helicase)
MMTVDMVGAVNEGPESFAEIVVFNALQRSLHYQVPAALSGHAQLGKRVVIPLGRREALGLIIGLQVEPPRIAEKIAIREILAVVDDRPTVPEDLITLCRWIAQYYFFPLGEVLQSALPANIQLRPEIGYRITAAGREAFQESDGSELLQLLRSRSPLSLLAITNQLGAPKALQKQLNQLENEGRAERYTVWNEPAAHPKTVKMIRLGIPSRDLPASSTNMNLRSLVAELESAGGALPLKTLRHRVKNLDYWVAKLTRAGIVSVELMEELRHPHRLQSIPCADPPVLTPDQADLFQTIAPHLHDRSFKPFLLHGVTGSGKTEIYLRLIEEALEQGQGALVLVPEIALSAQLEALFRQRLGAALAIWHSALSPGARYDQWRQALAGNSTVILGVRSAVFMPIKNLGIIIVDEEHDLSYKQEDRLRYHARDVALVRAQMLQIPIILGSATPSLQSVHHSQGQRYAMLSLPQRILDRPMPSMEVVDMRNEKGKFKILSGKLQRALEQTTAGGQQAILFLNRRGFATFLLCRTCGEALQCPHCSVSLTYHRKRDRLRCHYCGWEQALPEHCPRCDHTSLILHGFGTERVEQELRQLLPAVRIARMDRDTVLRPQDLVRVLDSIRNREADVLIGTQMVTKGHDFPNVTLVGVINADTSLQISDFRAGEITVQLLLQVAGRAGRGEEPGQVIIQTYNPQHPTIRCVLNGDYLNFCALELAARKQLQYPPFTKLLKLLVTDHREEMAQKAAQELARLCRDEAARSRTQNLAIAVLGPAPAPLWKLKKRYRWHIFIKAWTNHDLQQFTGAVLEQAKSSALVRRVQLSVDRDPMSTL